MRKILKVILIVALGLLSAYIIIYFTFNIITLDAKLDKSKLVDYSHVITICDLEGNEIANATMQNKNASVKVEDLSDHTINAFIASEDRQFFNHNGVNYGRMIKALFKNITSGSFKEGASTISQQLIKNTHLSNEKTITRKLKEIKLAFQLEKEFTKNDILEMYLNTIYFGHNCYGLQNASCFYFNKKAESLTLNESAVLVGLLSSPNNYSPIKNLQKSMQRRNIVLKAMLDCNYIDKNTYQTTIEEPILTKNTKSIYNRFEYVDMVFEELDGLKLDYYSLNAAKIITNMNARDQKTLNDISPEYDYSFCITNGNGGVTAFKSTIGNAKRQPGSTIKPLLVYAPSINEGLITLDDKILDEKINYGGYSPQNYDKKYRGLITINEAIKYSLNVPAVKTLNSLGIEKAENYAKKFKIEINKNDRNLSLALGGMTDGITLKELCDGYSTFANDGMFCQSHFIDKIIDKYGNVIYKRPIIKDKILNTSTCSLINRALIDTVKSGTAKKIGAKKYDLAVKTGTCGNQNGNWDTYAIGYTSDKCIGIWQGDKNNSPLKITSGNNCCKTLNEIVDKIYEDDTPKNLEINSGLKKIVIDREEYEKGNIFVADQNAPPLSKIEIVYPIEKDIYKSSNKFSFPVIEKPSISVRNNIVNIELCQTKYYSYIINRINSGKKTLIYNGKWKKMITDCPPNGIYKYSIIPYYCNGNHTYYGEEIYLNSISIGKNDDYILPDITQKEWY